MDGDGRSYVRLPARPRLLLITPDFPPAHGGIQLLAHRVASGLRDFDTRVVTLDSPGARDFDRASGLATRRVDARRAPGAARHLALNAAALREALAFRPHATLSAHIVASPAAALAARAVGSRTVQYFYAKEIPRRRRLAAFAARRAQACIAISSYSERLVAETGAGEADVRLIPPGVDLPEDPSPRPAGRPTFLTISRLEDRYKGHDVLLEALPAVRARVPDAQWVVIGDGPLRPELQARARAQGVADAVRFLGAVDDGERDDWLRRADLLAMPSRLPGEGLAGEGFGIVYLEASAYGKPVVAGNVGGAVDAVADGESGLLVDPTDARAVADAISMLLLDRALAQRLGGAGAERARRFAWPAIVARVRALLLEVLGEPLSSLDGATGATPRGGTST
ncbi:MAG TPA: glycosyltransferase family 4 protein [Solirubrobacteraceae bacterium]|nr:glycosyltransferase family 4 protein [Solirubrobacteraceae bacterium]